MKLQRLNPLNHRPKSLLQTIQKYSRLCSLIGQSLITDVQELQLEENALSEIYRDYKEETEKSLYGDCIYIWGSKNINDNLLRQRVHEFVEAQRKQVIKHLEEPIETEFKLVDFRDNSDSNIEKIRCLLQKESAVKKIKIAFLRNALDLESEVRDKALSFQIQSSIDTSTFKNLLSIAENKLSGTFNIELQEDLPHSLLEENRHPTDPAIQDLLNQLAFLDTPISMNVSQNPYIEVQPPSLPFLIRKPRRRIIGEIKLIQQPGNINPISPNSTLGRRQLIHQG